MTFLMSGCFFVLGLLLGSFYYVLGMRTPANNSIITPDSHCPTCKTPLIWYDLIPLLNFLITKGTCRHCHQLVKVLYPFGEVITGLLFFWVYLRFGFTFEGLIGFILVSLAIIISISDFKYMLIPNNILIFFLPILLILNLLFPLHSLWSHLLGAIAGGGIILLIVIVSRGAMGIGDAKLFFLCGLVLGFPYTLLGLFIACLLGSLVVGMLILLKMVKRKQPVPFGPFLTFATLITYGYGSDIIHLYLSILDNI